MFGLFESKSEKLVKKIYKQHRELCAAARNALNKNTDFWWNYLFETSNNMESLFENLMHEKSEEYAENIMMALMNEQSMPPEVQEVLLEKFMMSGNMHSFGKVFLVNEELESQILEKWSKDSE